MALLTFAKEVQGQHTQILSDNATAVAYINRQGGTRSKVLQSLAKGILSWAELHTLSLSAVHLKGTLNRVADFLSRNQILEAEWQLNPEVFQLIVQKWGRPRVDLFATQENSQMSRFFSLNRNEASLGVDALAQDWKFHLCYAFPPFQLIPRVIAKIRKEETTVILITPFWPKRPWFSSLLQMQLKPYWHLPLRKDLLLQGPLLHQEVAKLKLTAWLLRSSS